LSTNIKSGALTEQLAEEAFSKQSPIFDDIYAGNTIVHYKRERVRRHVNQYLPPASHILELNAGTGEDSTYFAAQGHKVHATDISVGMQQQLVAKAKQKNLDGSITNELCSFTQLSNLKNRGPYDLIFSNFAGLNCTDRLDDVLRSFAPLLKPNGLITLVVLPEFCLWETLMLFKGKFKTAFRRFNANYNPSYIINTLKNDYELVGLEGLCTIVPPSYIEHFAEKHANAYNRLKALEEKKRYSWPWKSIGDYYIITLRKKG
jgi:ubiquinone/menaquinone biosynthesis C-methylase UbiE